MDKTTHRAAILVGCMSMILPMWLGLPKNLSPTSSLTAVVVKVSPTPTPGPSDSSSILQELQKIEQKIQTPKKNFWDYLSSLSGLIAGVLVATIGAVATYLFNKRQREAEDSRKDRELAITRIQTMEAFLPHLKSSDERDKEAAILAITSLGDNVLMQRVATLYRGEGVVKALAQVATRAPGAAKIAKRALDEVLGLLQQAVVVVKSNTSTGSGFVAGDGQVVTVTYVLPEQQSEPIHIQFYDGTVQEATVLVRDDSHMLAVLATDSRNIPPLKIASRAFLPSSNNLERIILANPTIIILGYQGDTARDLVSVGTILDLTEEEPELAAGPLLIANIETVPGFSGAPAVDTYGEVVGVEHAYKDGKTFLIHAASVADILAQANKQTILKTLRDAGGPMRIQQLREQIRLSLSETVSQLRDLEEQGLITIDGEPTEETVTLSTVK